MTQALVDYLSTRVGISSICNILGAIKTAKYYDMGKDDLVVTVCTDGLDRYGSVMDDMRRDYGAVDEAEAVARVRSLFHGLHDRPRLGRQRRQPRALAQPEVLHLGRAAGQDRPGTGRPEGSQPGGKTSSSASPRSTQSSLEYRAIAESVTR